MLLLHNNYTVQPYVISVKKIVPYFYCELAVSFRDSSEIPLPKQ